MYDIFSQVMKDEEVKEKEELTPEQKEENKEKLILQSKI